MRITPLATLAVLAATLSGVSATHSAPASKGAVGWLDWRGPLQTGVSLEKGLPDKWTVGGPNQIWAIDFGGAGTPIIANGRVYALGVGGSGADMYEILLCADAETGKKIWERRFNDYLSDIAYNRYAIGSPCVDPETGNVYVISAAGEFHCFTADGKPVWRHDMMESFGRLTFTNGRNGSPWIDGDLVYTRYLTSNWGAEGPASDRFYAFDKKTGGLVWSSTPSTRPKDNSFARPWMGWRKGKRVMYTGTGDGSVVCLDARTGKPIWRFPLSAGGMNASVVLYKDKLIAIHADENLDQATSGRQVAIDVNAEPKAPAPEGGAPLLDPSAEVWRNDLEAVSSSPVLVGNRIYQSDKTGHLAAVDADTGKVLWRHKLAPDQLHASPVYADGKIYVGYQNGGFFIIRPTDQGAVELSKTQIGARSLGAPSVWNGKIYVMSNTKLYCFGSKTGKPVVPPAEPKPKVGPPVALQVIPSEVLLHPGQKVKFTVRGIDANGYPTGTYDPAKVKWAKYIPPTARVRSEIKATFNAQGELVAAPDPVPSAGAFEATINGLKGYGRGRVVPSVPFTENFESFRIDQDHATEGVKFAYPPLPWIGARFKFEVRELDGNKVLAKTLDNIFFQRATVFIGSPDMKNYTLEADVMSDGNRRVQSSVGLINQRYRIVLQGNAQELEVESNQDRVRVSVPFKWATKQWYHLKTRVDTKPDGSGVIRAKCWKKGEPEPSAWTIEVPHAHAHRQGSPGFFGFAPQSMFRVYIDNITATPNS